MTLPSARVIDLRNPSGLPLRAGMNFAVSDSPTLSAFGPTLLMPRSASEVAEPVVNTQSVLVSSAFLTVMVIEPCGLTNWSLVSVPAISFSAFMSKMRARGWCAWSAAPASRHPQTTTHPKARPIICASVL